VHDVPEHFVRERVLAFEQWAKLGVDDEGLFARDRAADADGPIVGFDLNEDRFDLVVAVAGLAQEARPLGLEARVKVDRTDQAVFPDLTGKVHRASDLAQLDLADLHRVLYAATPPSLLGSDAPLKLPWASIPISWLRPKLAA